ncbi:extracellular solute-binding protein [Prosthecomicrobium sp. N25]|uniref:extracellular solute-binding protein n=1 Tax=Prosthecomicrobium sp. N25 TaxID=3129254 RepID=UPI003076999D
MVQPAARPLFALALALLTAVALPGRSHAEEPAWRHGASLMGDIKYPADFKRFDYVNPNAPKGGTVRFAAQGTFDNLNIAVTLKGNLAAGIGNLYDSLMTSSLDEPSSQYGEIAEALRYPADFSWVSFRLDPRAKWHDGKPITPEDVLWSYEIQRETNPNFAKYYNHVKEAKVTGEREVTFTFDQAGNRELPQIVGQITVLPKHWWEGKGPDGQPRNVRNTSLEVPLGSGPYRVKSFEPGRTIAYERVKDYWGEGLPAKVGQNNFDEIRYDYYRDPQVALEAFKGDNYDFRVETSAKNWATAYEFPAKSDGRVILERFEQKSSGGMQAFVVNLRRDKFKDVRVRRALNLAFDFETLNRTAFYDQYQRTNSYFAPMELAATGLPGPDELKFLEPLKAKIPPEVFTTEYKNPVGGDQTAMRANLRQALTLLKEAGYENQGGRLVKTDTKQPLTIEFLLDAPTFERVAVPYRESLKLLGIDLVVRIVDDAQYENRTRARDFDMIINSFGQSLSPGNEQLYYWGSEAADIQGSANVAGIKNEAVDSLIRSIIYAPNREDLVAATKALDRVLLWNQYMIPQWHYGYLRTARWDRFGRPETMPDYFPPGFPTTWWWDADKAAKVGTRK